MGYTEYERGISISTTMLFTKTKFADCEPFFTPLNTACKDLPRFFNSSRTIAKCTSLVISVSP